MAMTVNGYHYEKYQIDDCKMSIIWQGHIIIKKNFGSNM